MQRRRGRLFAVGAAAAALAMVAGACGSSGGSKSSGGSGSSSQHVTLTVWTYYTGADQLNALKLQDQYFEQSHPGVTVKQVQVAGTELDPKLLASAAAKTGPDVFLDNVVVDFPELTAAGALYPLTKFWDAYPARTQYPSAGIWKGANNQIYNVMSYSNLLGMYYNKTILDKYHLKPPTTQAQLVSDMAVVTKAGTYGALAASADPEPDGAWTWYPILLDKGVNYCNTTATNMLPMFQTIAAWTKAGYLPKEAATWSQSDSWTQFESGKYAFGINGNWNLGDARAAKFAWGTTQIPSVDGVSHVFPGGEGLGIGAFSKHIQLDWEYLESAWLSKQANIIDFEQSGQIPTRADVAQTEQVKKDVVAAPFVAATKTVSAWPRSAKTAEMQVSVATEISDVVSGQASPTQAAATSSADLKADIGGHAC